MDSTPFIRKTSTEENDFALICQECGKLIGDLDAHIVAYDKHSYESNPPPIAGYDPCFVVHSGECFLRLEARLGRDATSASADLEGFALSLLSTRYNVIEDEEGFALAPKVP